MKRIAFTVDGEPVAKARARSFRLPTGKIAHFTPPETARYENLVRLNFAQVKPNDWAPHEGPVEMLIMAFFPIPQSWPKWKKQRADSEDMKACCRRDWDNVGKIVSDALNEIAYRDDRQVTDPTVMKRYSPRPRLEVTLVFHEPYTRKEADHVNAGGHRRVYREPPETMRDPPAHSAVRTSRLPQAQASAVET